MGARELRSRAEVEGLREKNVGQVFAEGEGGRRGLGGGGRVTAGPLASETDGNR